MRAKNVVFVVVCTAVLIVVGLRVAGLAVRVARKGDDLDRIWNESQMQTNAALKAAWREARETVREKLRREESDLRKTDAEAAARRRDAAQKRRVHVKRFFSAHGFTASESYRQAAALPKEDPTDEDQEIIDLAGEAASEADLDTAADVLEAALASKDPRARMSAVEMLSGLGEAGLSDIAAFLADPHPEVANLAADRWEIGIQELMDEKEQAALAKVGFLAITDEDQLRSLGGTIMLVSDAKLAVDALTEVIRDGAPVQRAAAREAYESVTGEKWIDEKAAAAWLAENYEPPEPEESEPEASGEEPDPASEGEGAEEAPESDSEDEATDDLNETTQTREQENESDRSED